MLTLSSQRAFAKKSATLVLGGNTYLYACQMRPLHHTRAKRVQGPVKTEYFSALWAM